MSQEIHKPEPTPQQDAQEDQECYVRAMWENLLLAESTEEARKRCPLLLNLQCRKL